MDKIKWIENQKKLLEKERIAEIESSLVQVSIK